ncbi:MAG: hypothetical protein E7559_08180 [Ruminococcaceae bacterium]|nr:hypothetical protein [Oscillospiraceae bacterium]
MPSFFSTVFPTKAVRTAKRLSRGYHDVHCEKDLKWLADSIIRPVYPNNIRLMERQLERMEMTYYLYRIANLKYNNPVDKDKGTSTGVLEYFRKLLKEIILEASVPPKIKKEAISILMAQQSNRTLYEIARNELSIGQFIDPENNISVAYYIIDHFPKNADHDLINLAFYWANRADHRITTRAIEKITSPKSLLTLCLFFHDNRNNTQYVEYIIDQLGKIIDDNSRELDKEGIDYLNVNCELEQNWLETHCMSMLFSAHMALSKIVVVFADDSTIVGNRLAVMEEERRLVVHAIEKMNIPGFLQRIIQSNNDGFKVAKCEARRNMLTHFKLTDEVCRERLIQGVCTDQEMIEAIRQLDFNAPENLGVAHTLADRLQWNMERRAYTPKLSDTVGYEFCVKYYGGHQFKPDGNGEHFVEKCVHCGYTQYAMGAIFLNGMTRPYGSSGDISQLPPGSQSTSNGSDNPQNIIEVDMN